MNDFSKIISKTVSESESVLNSVQNILVCEAYCVQTEIYCTYLRQNRKKAERYYQNFREMNDKIFSMAMKILDTAINEANAELVESAIELIETMKNTYPDFYKAYFKQLFGR